MKICPKCQRSISQSQRVETDKKTKKNWLITFCAKCMYNFDIEEYQGKVLPPHEELENQQWENRHPKWS